MSSVRRLVRSSLRWCLTLVVPTLLLFLGGTDERALHFLAIFVFAITAAATIYRASRHVRLLVYGTATLCAVILAYALVQAYVPTSWLNALGLEVPSSPTGRISLVPGDTASAIVAVALPFSIFLAGLHLTGRSAARTMVTLVIILTVIVAASLVQYALFPGYVLLLKKEYYTSSFTLTLINRNTAATYLGVILVICVARLLGFSKNQATLRIVIPWILIAGGCAAALLLTVSRAGIAAAFLGLVVVVFGYLLVSGHTLALTRKQLVIVLLGVVALGGMGLWRALLRGAVQSEEGGRFCMFPHLARLVSDNWLFGSGLGTFQTVFPAYREPSCGITGSWEMAHNFYVEGWASLGIIFPITCALGLVGLTAILVWGIARRRRERWVPLGALGALSLVAVHSVFDFSVQVPAVAALLALVMSLACAVSLYPSRSRPASATHEGSPQTAT